MRGIRAFGRNEGGLNHTGDFLFLFSPLVSQLADVAVFSPELSYSAFYSRNAPADWEEKLEALGRELESLRLPELKTKNAPQPYYGPGFFPKFAGYVVDDWNDVMCFKKPFPDWQRLSDARFSEEHAKGFKTGDNTRLREIYTSLGFYLYFRNIDACFWECYAPDAALIEQLREHFRTHAIDFEELDFSADFPFGGLKQKRRFKDVHEIWSPET